MATLHLRDLASPEPAAVKFPEQHWQESNLHLRGMGSALAGSPRNKSVAPLFTPVGREVRV